jgi:hypothetical protein
VERAVKGAHVQIRHVRPSDYAELHRIESDPTDAIVAVETLREGRIASYVQLHDVDLRAGHGWLSIYAGAEHRGRGAVMEGLMPLRDWVFLNTPLRWIYAPSFEHNVDAFASGFRRGESLHLGVLRERVLVDGTSRTCM